MEAAAATLPVKARFALKIVLVFYILYVFVFFLNSFKIFLMFIERHLNIDVDVDGRQHFLQETSQIENWVWLCLQPRYYLKLLIALSPLSQIPAIFHQSAGCFDKSIQRPTFCTVHCRSRAGVVRADVVRGRVQVGKVVCRFYCAVCMSLSYMYKTVTFYILAKDGSLFIKLMAPV